MVQYIFSHKEELDLQVMEEKYNQKNGKNHLSFA